MIRASLPRSTPGLADVLADAVASLSHCADVVATAGCAPAVTYVSGAQGAVRRALAELVNRSPHLARDAEEFDVTRCGASEVIGVAGYADTIRGCLAGGLRVDVRALVQKRDVERATWMRPTGELEDVHVRGRVELTTEGYRFIEEPDLEFRGGHLPRPDLARDLIASGLDLAGRPSFAAALEVTLATGSWVHLPTNTRWFADLATARAVVRLAGGSPGVDARLLQRLGTCVDRAVLRLIEGLGWRHWTTPSVRAAQAA